MSNVIIEITENNIVTTVSQIEIIGNVISSVPTTPTSTGIKNQIAFDNTHLYICVGTNSWKRVIFENWT